MARRRSGRKIDFTHWTGGNATSLAQAAGSVGVVVIPAQHDPETELRIRGSLLSYVDTTQAPGGLVLMSVGLIYVPAGTGTTVLWAPFTDADAPWVWVDYFFVGYEEMVTDVIDVPAASGYRSVIDSKAMRIVRNSELQAVFQNTTIGSSMAVNNVLFARVLSGT